MLETAARHRASIRNWLSIETEYRLRRALCRLIPADHPARETHFLHCCAPKTGSQHARMLLSDPRLYRHHGHLPYFASEPPKDPRRGALWTSLYWPYPVVKTFLERTPAARAIFVMRDPRDLLVSWYFSNRYSHHEVSMIADRRRRLSGLSEEEAITATIKNFSNVAFLLATWMHATDPRVRLVRFEDLTGAAARATWQDVFRHFGFEAPDSAVDALLRYYDVSRLRASDKPGAVVSRYRSSRPGDWRNVLTPAHVADFENRYGMVIDGLGYR